MSAVTLTQILGADDSQFSCSVQGQLSVSKTAVWRADGFFKNISDVKFKLLYTYAAKGTLP